MGGVFAHSPAPVRAEDDAVTRKTKRKKPAPALKNEQTSPNLFGIPLPDFLGGYEEFPSTAQVRYAPNGRPYINPSEDVDEDEVDFDTWTDLHPFKMFLLLWAPTFVYLIFYS